MQKILLLFMKNGEFSKTSVMLWITFGTVLAKYLFAGQTVGGVEFGVFDEVEAMSMLGVVSGLYIGANVRGKPKEQDNARVTATIRPGTPIGESMETTLRGGMGRVGEREEHSPGALPTVHASTDYAALVKRLADAEMQLQAAKSAAQREQSLDTTGSLADDASKI